ncbi:MAG: lysophospholipid acyltransferase family protein [Gammaproteobacteria bacterium]
MRLLRSALFNFTMWASVLIYAPLALLTAPLPYRARYRFIAQWPRFHLWTLKHLCRIDHVVEGAEHLPPGPAVVLANHQSTWETLAFTRLFPPQTWVLKRELAWIPLFGWALALLKPIAINRGAGRRAVDQVVTQGRARLGEGIWVMVFPEGTRVAPGATRRWGIGGAVLAAETGYPVVPVAHNAGYFWRRRSFVKHPGTVRVAIGPAIETRGKTPEEINRAAQSWVETQMARWSAEQRGAESLARAQTGSARTH